MEDLKYCAVCGEDTPHSKYGCDKCGNATVPFICDKMGVCRQAVYLKAERKGFEVKKKKPKKGGREIRVFTKDQSRILIEKDDRYKSEDVGA